MITLALIGAGKWGRNYIRAIKGIPNAQIKYVSSGYSSLKALPEEYVKVNDYHEIADKGDVDGVIIATPASTHYQVSEFFIKKNRPLLIEKPITVSLDEAKKLKKLLHTGQKVMVGNIFLYNPAFRKAVNMASSLGKIHYLEFQSGDMGPVRNDVSALWDWAFHDVSMCLEIMKKNPINVSAWGTSNLRPHTSLYDLIYIKLLFPQNVHVFIHAGWLFPSKKRNMTVVGTKGIIFFDDVSKRKIVRYTLSQNHEVENIYYPSYPHSEPLIEELKDFISAIENNKKPLSDFDKSFNLVRVLDAAEKSIQKGGSVIKID